MNHTYYELELHFTYDFVEEKGMLNQTFFIEDKNLEILQ